MTDKTALRQLIEAVDAGKIYLPDSEKWESLTMSGCLPNKAFEGSLDAAKALHDALLPGFSAGIGFNPQKEGSVAIVFKTDERGIFNIDQPTYESEARPEARAWLIAILKAYEAQP